MLPNSTPQILLFVSHGIKNLRRSKTFSKVFLIPNYHFYMRINLTKSSVSEAFSAGIGLALGLTMSQYMFKAMRPPEKMIKQVIICLRCGSKNPVENKFCGQCGQAFYPPSSIHCPKCGFSMPLNMNFCGRCGSPLRKTKKTGRKRK
jgi:ribosomal protein L40E